MANTTGRKYGGRKKGTPNKMTKELRTLLKDIVYYELEHIEDKFGQLEPKDRIKLLIKMMPYVFPKLNSISHTTNEPLDWDLEKVNFRFTINVKHNTYKII